MPIVNALLDGSRADLDVIRLNRENGDNPAVHREIDFVFYCQNEEKAKLVSSFLVDNSYANPSTEYVPENPPESQWQLTATISMPCTEYVLCSVSGLMACIGHLFTVEYDGWSGPICRS
jgi:hypothetical protein